MGRPPTSPRLDDAIHRDQVVQLYRQQPVALSAAVVVAMILALLLQPRVGETPVAGWLGLTVLVLGVRWLVGRLFAVAAHDRSTLRRWERIFRAGVLASGLTWGLAGGSLFPPESVGHQALLVVVLAGLSAASVTTLSSIRGMALWFSVPAMLPVLVQLVLAGTSASLGIAVLVLVFLVGLAASSRRLNRMLGDAFRLRHAHELGQQALGRQRRLYEALSRTMQAGLECPDAESLYVSVCRIAVHSAGFRGAWVALPDHDSGLLRVAAAAGAGAPQVRRARVAFAAHLPEAAGPTGRAFRSGRPVIERDFLRATQNRDWHSLAREAGVRAAASFPVIVEGEPRAVFTVYAADPELLTPDLVGLLEEMARSVGGAVERYRAEERRREASAELAEREQLYRQMFLNNRAIKLLIDPGSGAIVDANQAAARFYGHPRAQLMRMNIRDINTGARDAVRAEMGRARSGEADHFRFRHRLADGEIRDVEVYTGPVRVGGRVYLHSIIHDVTERLRAEAVIRRQARFDPLTELANRRHLLERLGEELARARRHGHRGALLFMDLDRFKHINDSLGHSVGDQVLQAIARRLVAEMRREDLAARLGGDEFVLLLPELEAGGEEPRQVVSEVARRIRRRVAEPVHPGGHELRVTPSIGVVMLPHGSASAEDILKYADTAMYAAKARGRDSVCFFNREMAAASGERLSLENDLHRGVEHDEFHLVYQPQVDEGGRVVGAEALLRWTHPERGPVSPAEFIPVSEETGLILAIGERVLERVVRLLTDPSMPRIAVNISPRQFAEDDFVERLVTILERHGVAGERLKLELTESLLVADVDRTVRQMEALRAHAIRFAVDDFGTGYSSLAYLKRLPIDELKIDQSFVRDIPGDANDCAIVESIIAMSRHLGLEVIAEGVETAAQRDYLAASACHAYQGFHFARPMPEPALRSFLETHGLARRAC